MKLKFLGINGFELQANGKTLLIDPYVTRDRDRLSVPAVVRKHIKEADYIFLGHSHWDHAADVAESASYTGAIIYGSETNGTYLRLVCDNPETAHRGRFALPSKNLRRWVGRGVSPSRSLK